MFIKTTPHALHLEHFNAEPESHPQSNTLETLLPVFMIAVGVVGILLFFTQWFTGTTEQD